MRWPSLSLIAKLWLGVGGVVLFLAVSLGCYQYAITMMARALDQLLYTEIAIDRNVGRAESAILECRRAEKDFLLNRDPAQISTFESRLAELLTRCKTIRGLAHKAGYPDLANRAAQSTDYANRYGSIFERIVAVWERRGLTHDSGLQGHLRQVIHRVSAQMAEHDADTVRHSLARLRESEKEYLYTKSAAGGDAWREALAAMRVAIEESTCGDEIRNRLNEYVARYDELQQQLIAAGKVVPEADAIPSERKDAEPTGETIAKPNGPSGDTLADDIDDIGDRIVAETASIHIPNVAELLLSIRRWEKDYLLRGDEDSIRKTREAVEAVRKAIGASQIDARYIQRATVDLADYLEAFDTLVAEDRAIRENTREMKSVIRELTPIIRDLAIQSEQLSIEKTKAAETRSRFLSRMAVIAGAISGFAAIVLALALPPAIFLPIQKCTQFARDVADGDLGGRLEVGGQDEIGELAAALNQMARSLGAMLHNTKEAGERERAATAEKAEQERRLAEAERRREAEAVQRRQQEMEEERRREQALADEERQRAAHDQRQAKALRRKVDHLLKVVAAAAEGDLTQDIHVDGNEPVDELAVGIQRMLRELARIIAEATQSTQQFTEGSFMIAQSTQSLAVGAQTQGANLKQMTSSISELTRSIEAVRENSFTADKIARETTLLAEEGDQAIQKSAEAMELMRESAGQIGEIIQVISEIANQTNLLALNAAIEAARAGEHGLGFAVVADEVRKLAERSNQAADEIAKLIRQSTQRVEEGAELSDRTGKALKRIISGVESTADGISQIAELALGQTTIAAEVSTAVAIIGEITEQVTAGSEEMAASSQQLGANADRLRTIVSRFKI